MTSTKLLWTGDCREWMQHQPDQSVNLIMTSPPYANLRKRNYGGKSESEYCDWFLERMEFAPRILTDAGSMIVNIKESLIDGQRSLYVFHLVEALVKEGWRFVDGMIWVKKNPTPGKWPNRLKDAWEWCLHFSKQKQIKFEPDRLRKPMKPNSINRRKTLTEKYKNYASETDSGIVSNLYRSTAKDTALPSNVIYESSEVRNRFHPAVYPESIPNFFIQLLTDENDWVYDPFCGSGTTLISAGKLNRNSAGTDVMQQYVFYSRVRNGILENVL